MLAVGWGVWVAHAMSCATEQEGLYFPFHIKPRRTAPSRHLIIRLEIDSHAILHVELARVELMLVIARAFRLP